MLNKDGGSKWQEKFTMKKYISCFSLLLAKSCKRPGLRLLLAGIGAGKRGDAAVLMVSAVGADQELGNLEPCRVEKATAGSPNDISHWNSFLQSSTFSRKQNWCSVLPICEPCGKSHCKNIALEPKPHCSDGSKMHRPSPQWRPDSSGVGTMS